jgi:hypothetical protein
MKDEITVFYKIGTVFFILFPEGCPLQWGCKVAEADTNRLRES